MKIQLKKRVIKVKHQLPMWAHLFMDPKKKCFTQTINSDYDSPKSQPQRILQSKHRENLNCKYSFLLIKKFYRELWKAKYLFLIVFLGHISACATRTAEKELRSDVGRLQLQVSEILQESNKNSQKVEQSSRQTLASLSSQFEKQNIEIQKLAGEVDRLRVGILTGQLPGQSEDEPSLAKSLDALETKVRDLEDGQETILKAIKETEKEPTAPEKNSSPSLATVASFKAAFKKKRYKAISSDYRTFLKQRKSSASDKETVLFLASESLYKLGQISEAALTFNEFTETFKKSSDLAAAKLRLGDCFRLLGEKATSKLYYQEVVSRFPDSPEAKAAKDQLTELEKKGS